MNDYQLLGNVAEQRLVDIWHGEPARELRRAMERHDLTVGCEFCKWQVDEGRPDMAFARWFDSQPVTAPEPDWPSQLELSISQTCNLQCAMCNAEWSSSIRVQREGLPPLPKVYDDRFFEDLREFLPHLDRIKFLGGEPFLAVETLRVMEMLVEMGLRTRCHVTTNGTQWTPRVERILDMLPVDVAVSLDAATAATYESIRIGSSWDQVQDHLDRFQQRAAANDTDVTVTFCLMTSNWHEFGDFCRAADERGIGCAVNTVTEPAHLSLLKQPPDELHRIVDALEATDRRIGASLGRSARTWRDELRRLRSHLDSREHAERVTGIDQRRLNPEFPRPFAAAADTAAAEDTGPATRVGVPTQELEHLLADLGDDVRRLELDASRPGGGGGAPRPPRPPSTPSSWSA
jgi:MoaA/NifB/PqqE/SkfB family radical SAM enzyme